jgi:hypothetical protein
MTNIAATNLTLRQEPLLALNQPGVFNLLFAVFETALEKSRQLERKEKELLKAMDVIRELREIIHACAHCKKVRDDNHEWREVEGEQPRADYSHTVCPECAEAFYPDFIRKSNNFSLPSLER